MANIKSQIKRNRQNDKKRLRNRVYRGEARIAVKNARTNIEDGVPESKAALQQAISALDKAAEQGVIHKNNAARRKSRLVKAFNKMEPVKVVTEPVAVEPVAEAEPVKKKAAPRATSAKAKASDKKETPAPKGDSKVETKKAAAKKPAVKKTEEKKTAAKKTVAKKTTTTKKPTAK